MRRSMKHNATQVMFGDLSGGINVMNPGDLIAPNEMQECQNFYFLGYNRTLVPRGGLSKPRVTFPADVMGTYYDIDSNTFLAFLMNGAIYRVTSLTEKAEHVGTLTGTKRPLCAKFKDMIWIASGDKLQSYDFGAQDSVKTIDAGPVCDLIFQRGARLCAVMTGSDRVMLSGVGDGTQWNTDDNDASTGAWVDVGYGDSGDIIAAVPLATDMLLIKNNGMIYQLAGDKDVRSWAVYRVATNTDAVGRVCAEAVGNDVVFVSRQGMKTMRTTMDYGNIAQGDIGEKWNALVTDRLYEPAMFHLRRRKLLLIRPTAKHERLIAYNYTMGAATTLLFPLPVTSVEETIEGVVVASGNALYELDKKELSDNGTPIPFRMRLRDLVSTEKIIVRSVDTDMKSSQAGEARIEIDNMKITVPTNTRRKVRCNHSSPRIETLIHGTAPFELKHIALEVADL